MLCPPANKAFKPAYGAMPSNVVANTVDDFVDGLTSDWQINRRKEEARVGLEWRTRARVLSWVVAALKEHATFTRLVREDALAQQTLVYYKVLKKELKVREVSSITNGKQSRTAYTLHRGDVFLALEFREPRPETSMSSSSRASPSGEAVYEGREVRMMLPIGSVLRNGDDLEDSEESSEDDDDDDDDDDDESDDSEEDVVPKHPAAKHYGWVCTVFIGKDKKAPPKPVLQRCWRDGSPMEYRAVGAGQPQRKALDPHSDSDSPMMLGDQCELLDDFDAGVYSGGPLSKYGQRHVHTKSGWWVSTRRNPPKPIPKAKAKGGKKGGAKKKSGAAGGAAAGSDKKKATPKKKTTPKGKDKATKAAAKDKVEQGTSGLAVLDQLAEENERAGDDGSYAADEVSNPRLVLITLTLSAPWPHNPHLILRILTSSSPHRVTGEGSKGCDGLR